MKEGLNNFFSGVIKAFETAKEVISSVSPSYPYTFYLYTLFTIIGTNMVFKRTTKADFIPMLV